MGSHAKNNDLVRSKRKFEKKIIASNLFEKKSPFWHFYPFFFFYIFAARSKTLRAGLQFPVGRVKRMLRKGNKNCLK